MKHDIELAESVTDHLEALSARERSMVIQAMGNQLSREPLVETRNRKRLRPNPIAPWELRVGALRVFYDVAVVDSTHSAPPLVRILAVGKKDRDVLRIGAKVVTL
jgi:hypothetical protein